MKKIYSHTLLFASVFAIILNCKKLKLKNILTKINCLMSTSLFQKINLSLMESS